MKKSSKSILFFILSMSLLTGIAFLWNYSPNTGINHQTLNYHYDSDCELLAESAILPAQEIQSTFDVYLGKFPQTSSNHFHQLDSDTHEIHLTYLSTILQIQLYNLKSLRTYRS